MNEPLPSAINPPLPPPPSPKRKLPPPTTAAHQKTHTLIHPAPWLYLHLELHGPTTTTTSDDLDALTARSYLTSALSQFLGLTGAAIPVDILHLRGREVWVRVARGDGSAVVAAVSGWVGGGGGQGSAVGWRVRGRGAWLGGLVGGDGGDLFAE